MTTIPENARLRGMATCVYLADDLDAARHWYTEVLGIEPYLKHAVATGGGDPDSGRGGQ